MEFLGSKTGLEMELEYGKFHVELYSQSGMQGGFPALIKMYVQNRYSDLRLFP